MEDKIRVIIIDDESLARSITRKYLSVRNEFEILAECSNGIEAVKKMIEISSHPSPQGPRPCGKPNPWSEHSHSGG